MSVSPGPVPLSPPPEGSLNNTRTGPCALLKSFVQLRADVSCIHDASWVEMKRKGQTSTRDLKLGHLPPRVASDSTQARRVFRTKPPFVVSRSRSRNQGVPVSAHRLHCMRSCFHHSMRFVDTPAGTERGLRVAVGVNLVAMHPDVQLTMAMWLLTWSSMLNSQTATNGDGTHCLSSQTARNQRIMLEFPDALESLPRWPRFSLCTAVEPVDLLMEVAPHRR